MKLKKLSVECFLCVFLFSFIQGCSTVRQQTATPYPEKTEPDLAFEQKSGQETENVQSFPAQQPVAVALSKQADQLVRKGKLDVAAQTLERGLRIVPKDPVLWSELASVRLMQKLFQQARSFAAKSNSLAGGNSALLRKNFAIIRKAEKLQMH